MHQLILGDNPFFGVNHMSEEKARARAQRFAAPESIVEVIGAACDLGIRRFMCSTHGRMRGVADLLRKDRARFGELSLYPSLPYAHKYANAVAERGLPGAIANALTQDKSFAGIVSSIVDGGMGLIERDPFRVMRLLVDSELSMFRGLRIEAVFLLNIVTDLLLGLRLEAAFKSFAGYIREKYHAEAGFMTMNLPALATYLDGIGLRNCLIGAAINPIGYLMNPGRRECEEALRRGGFRPVAMSILASGAVPVHEAMEYVVDVLGIETVVFGASTPAHIAETKLAFEARIAARQRKPVVA